MRKTYDVKRDSLFTFQTLSHLWIKNSYLKGKVAHTRKCHVFVDDCPFVSFCKYSATYFLIRVFYSFSIKNSFSTATYFTKYLF